MSEHKCGYISIIGRPNVGKSTLLNQLIGEKLSITTRKPQTTRWQLLGIHSKRDAQFIFVDTPGVQKAPKNAINRYMNREALSTLSDVDVVLFVVEANKWTDLDEHALDCIKAHENLILVVNKIDKVTDKQKLLPFIQDIASKADFKEVLPLSAKKHEDMAVVYKKLKLFLPEGEAIFAEDDITDKNIRFLVAEYIREKLTMRLGQELPYRLTVTIEQFKETNERVEINALIWVEKDSQKSIVIGKGGEVLKSIGQQARKDIQNLLQQRVHLELWVKVKKDWYNDEVALQKLGYTSSN